MLEQRKICISILGYFPGKPLSCFINRMFHFDHSKHNGLFKYCDFNIHTFNQKNFWCMSKTIKNNEVKKKSKNI